MRKEYRKALRSRCVELVAEACPDFSVVKPKAPTLGGGETVMESARAGFHAFFLFVPSPTGRQAFTVEVAWSAQSGFPQTTARPSLVLDAPDATPSAAEGVVRIGDLIDGTDKWWELPDPALEHPGSLEALQRSLEPISAVEAAATVEPLVREAVDVLRSVAIPFVERMAARHEASGG